MSNIHVQVSMPSKTLQVEDTVVNTFNFIIPGAGPPGAADLNGILPHVIDFYNLDTASGNSIGERMSRAISRTANACTLKTYDVTNNLDGTPAGSPIDVRSFTLAAPAAAGEEGLPLEVAQVVTYHGAYTAGEFGPGGIRPRSRQRGRLYIGPLGVSCVAHSIADQPIAEQGWWDTVTDAAERLMTALAGYWAVWSRASEQMIPVVGGYVDAEFDTQRRRGLRGGGSKNLWGVN